MARVIIINFLISFLVVYFSTFFLRKLAVRFSIVDVPDGKKIHETPTPLLGGLAILLGVGITLCLNPQVVKGFSSILIGATIILLVNLIDDIRRLSARFRFSVELIVALAVVLSGVRISFLPPGFWGYLGEVVITIIWLVGVANAFNYLDGMDGLATGSAAINASFFALILYRTHQGNLGILSVILVAACLGFLPHNLRKARIFLGDAGSTFLGFMFAGIGVLGNWAEDGFVKISIPILVLGVPIFDMVFTTILRIKEHKVRTVIQWLKYGGKDHFHHYLVDLGFLPLGAVLFIWAITFSLGLGAVMVSNDRAWEGVLTLLQTSIIFMVIGVLIVVGKRRRRA